MPHANVFVRTASCRGRGEGGAPQGRTLFNICNRTFVCLFHAGLVRDGNHPSSLPLSLHFTRIAVFKLLAARKPRRHIPANVKIDYCSLLRVRDMGSRRSECVTMFRFRVVHALLPCKDQLRRRPPWMTAGVGNQAGSSLFGRACLRGSTLSTKASKVRSPPIATFPRPWRLCQSSEKTAGQRHKPKHINT